MKSRPIWVYPIWVQAEGNHPTGRGTVTPERLQAWIDYFAGFFPEERGVVITPDPNPKTNPDLYVHAKGSDPHTGLRIMLAQSTKDIKLSTTAALPHGQGPFSDLYDLVARANNKGIVGQELLRNYFNSTHGSGETVAAYIVSLLLKIAKKDQQPAGAPTPPSEDQAGQPDQVAAPSGAPGKKKGDPGFSDESEAIPLNKDDAEEYGGQHMVSHEIGVSILPFVAALELAPKAGRKGFTDAQKRKLMQAFGFQTLDWGEAVQRAVELGYIPGGAK